MGAQSGPKGNHQVIRLTIEQIALSTDQEQRNYFTGVSGGRSLVGVFADPAGILPHGTYRVIDGTLYRVVPGPIPSLPISTKQDS